VPFEYGGVFGFGVDKMSGSKNHRVASPADVYAWFVAKSVRMKERGGGGEWGVSFRKATGI